MSFGPYHRIANPRTQSLSTAKRQFTSSEVWGRVPRGGIEPQVQAYDGPLPADRTGIEFVTELEPAYVKMSGEVRWSDDPESAYVDTSENTEYAVLRIKIIHARYLCKRN